MTDEIISQPTLTTTPAAETTPTITNTTAEAPVTTAVTETQTTSPVTETVEAPVVQTILNEPPKVEEPKVEEVKTEEAIKTDEGQSDEPAPPPPVYEAFNLPENMKVEEGILKEFTDILSKFETESKTKHELVQKFGQDAVDFYTKQIQKQTEDLTKFYSKSWDDQKVAWKDEFLKDPEIGGNRWQTTINAANEFIGTHGGTPEQQKAFRELMETSGLGNHPIMIRLLSNANRGLSEGKPLAASTPAPAAKSKTEALYGKRKNYISS